MAAVEYTLILLLQRCTCPYITLRVCNECSQHHLPSRGLDMIKRCLFAKKYKTDIDDVSVYTLSVKSSTRSREVFPRLPLSFEDLFQGRFT